MNGSEEPQSNPRKRRRPALSCEQCRRRKVRCDREVPCGPCTKAHPSLECLYVHEGKAVADARRESSRAVEESYTRLDESRASPNNGSAESARIAQLERNIQALQGRVKDLEGCLEDRNERRSGPGNGINGHGRHESSDIGQPQTFISPLGSRLKNDNGRVKVFGTTHWAIVFQQVSIHFIMYGILTDRICQFRMFRQARSSAIQADFEHNESGRALAEIRKLRHHIKNCQSPRLLDPAPGLLNDLPSREVCDQLVHNYLRTLGLIYRVLHIPSFYNEYKSFWEDPKSASRAFLLKLLLILAIGSIFHCEPGPLNELGLPIQRWVYAAQWWLSGPFSKEIGDLEGIQVYCLLLICRQSYAMDKETNWMSAGTLLRLAINQGLHRDPSHFPTVSVFDGEMRRRVWATVIELNIQLSIDTAMPPLLSTEDFDTRPPANIDDDDLDPSITVLPPVQLRDFYTVSSLQILLLQSFPTRLKITRMINECGREQVYERALQLGNELTVACKEMTALIHSHISRTRSIFKPTHFHAMLMDTLLRRFLLNLYRPFTIQALKDPRFYLSRKLSLDSALIIASYGDPPTPGQNTDLQPYQDFQRLAFSGAGLFKAHLSLDVIIVISLELITQIEEQFVPPSDPSLPPNPADQMAQAARAPLIQAFERIQGQLYESLVAGIPSMKRYCLLSGVLARIRCRPPADEAEEWSHIRASFLESMHTCRTLLQDYITRVQPAAGSGMLEAPIDPSALWTPESGLGSSLDSDLTVS